MIESYSDLLAFQRKEIGKLYTENKKLKETQFKIENAGYCNIDQVLEAIQEANKR